MIQMVIWRVMERGLGGEAMPYHHSLITNLHHARLTVGNLDTLGSKIQFVKSGAGFLRYLKSPTIQDESLADYIKHYTPETKDPQSANWWENTPKYIVSLLKAWYGDHATAENNFCYDYLPKRSGNYSYMSLFKDIDRELVKGLIVFPEGQHVAL